jgi:UDP-N-acetylmuramyl pentapeptide synthase
MLKSIEAFEQFPTNNKKIMVLADMLEQGDFKIEMHDLIVNKVNTTEVDNIEKIFYIGPVFAESAKKNTRDNVILANSFVEIAPQIYDYLNNQYCILFKGSNGMKLFYHITNYIKKESL